MTEWGIISWLDRKEEYPHEVMTADDQRKLLVIGAEAVQRAVVVRLPDDGFGLFLAGIVNEEEREWLILAEGTFTIGPIESELQEFLHELRGVSRRELGPSDLTEEEYNRFRRLWNLRKAP